MSKTMDTRFAVLPKDIINTLSLQLDEKQRQDNALGLRFLRLPHPRTGDMSLFLVNSPIDSDVSKILEVQSICPNAARSWFNEGEVIADGSLLVMTPVDPAFLLFPVMQASYPIDGSTANFRTLDDLFEEGSSKLSKANDGGRTMSDSLKHVCETKEITEDLTVYRFCKPIFLSYLEKKVNRLSKSSAVEKSSVLLRELAKDGLMDDGKEKLLECGRLKLACDLISQYVPQPLYQELLAKFDFSALDAHIAALQNENILAIKQANGNVEKQNAGGAEANDKKRKAAAQGSKGVEKLKKVNVKGMAKLSTFFQKSRT